MNNETSLISNSGLMLMLCIIPIAIVIVQAGIFLNRAWKEAERIGIDKGILKKVVVNSAVFSIVPSLPIIIIMAVLMPTLGTFFPWLRLTVIGSAMYENMAADITVKAFGLAGVADPGMTPAIFLSVAWVMTIGIISYPIWNIIALKKYDKKLKSMREKGGFIEKAIPALFIGVMAVLGAPMLVDFKNLTGITTIIIAGILVMLLEKIAAKTKINALKDFSFPISMIIGMATAIPFSKLFAQMAA